jgi:beta-galactosidase GanA
MSIRSLARANGTGFDTIKSAVTELEAYGYLVRSEEQKRSDDGTFADYEWRTADPSQNPDTGKSRHGETEHKEEQVIRKTITKNKQENNLDDLFNEFWTAYPRKLDKAKAFRAFRSALKRAKFEDILAGVIAYRNDPKRDPDYTKYPATWLNNDAWENAATTPEARAANEARREKAIAASDAYLKELEELAKDAAPPPQCKHGESIARCKKCLK